MIKEVFMPKAGLTMVEGTITEWKVAEGAEVKKGDVIMEYENEKNTIDCEALADGFIHITAQIGDTIPIGEIIGFLAETKEEYDSIQAGTANLPSGGETKASTPEEEEKGCARECPTCVHEGDAASMPSAAPAMQNGRVRASGLARKMAAEAGINLADVPAPNGRVQARDIENYMKTPRPAANVAGSGEIEDIVTEIPWIGVKKTIANNMLNSITQTAQSTCMVEVDVTDFLALRKKLVENMETIGCKVSINDLLCKMLGKVLAKHPLANATFDGKTLYAHSHVHLSVAVSTDNGLMVPVVRNIDTLTLLQIHEQIKTFAQQARDKTLPAGAQSGGTSMITNFGVFPMDFSTPILNKPNTCLVGFGRPNLKPVVLKDGSIGARQMMYVTVTLDHQVLDGNEVGAIFADIKEYLENPELILV